MKAVRMHAPGGANALVFEDAPDPKAGPGQALIKVHATAVTPHELSWPSTWQTANGSVRSFTILGHEFSGMVAALGSASGDVAVGDLVYGIIDAWFADGAEAELVVAPFANFAPKPRSIGHAEASVVPISGLTAWQALFDRGRLERGQRVLVHGGAGGVGSFAVQLARWRGAHVIATASADNLTFVRELGADVVVDHRTQRFEVVAGDVDVVLDVVGGETLERSRALVKPGGTIVSVAGESQSTPYFFYVEANRGQLIELARLIDDGAVKPIVDAVLPLSRASEAYQRKARKGKTVLEISA